VATSPALRADEIRAPVFIAHGSEDPTVHVEQTERMIDALQDAGRPVESYIYSGETHGFIDERNRIDFYAKLGEFFQRHLLGDVKPPPAPQTASAR
jgi:dipeptidyl aminopeptidase/acylaminoacyl peptidase